MPNPKEPPFSWNAVALPVGGSENPNSNVKKQKQTQNIDFRDIKMYNTVFNYNGFGLQATQTETPNSCVPEYLLKLYNNPAETNPRKRLVKLKMDKILQELNMKTIDEGCSITQIAVFCDIHKITYYVIDFKQTV